jgi:hypothetical protein
MRLSMHAARSARWAVVVSALAAPLAFGSAPGDALRDRHGALAEELARNSFQRPLHLESAQSAGDLKGEVYAVVDHPFATVESALKGAEPWCDILILHLNVKHCRASGGPPADVLAVSVGKKHDQPLSDAYRVNFVYRLAASAPDYLQVVLSAKEGPLGTSNYRIAVEATPLDARRTFLHMSYAYGYGFAARIAMQGYLSTLGSAKVGFSVVGRKPDGQPVYVDNVRGVVERNTMRYYLAIDSYLASLSAPPAERQTQRLRDWFAATERYALQLHEVDEKDYLAMKRKEIARQQEPPRAGRAG